MSLILVLCAAAILDAAPASEEPAVEPVEIDAESVAALAEILASDALMQEQQSGNAADDGRWAVRDILLQGFAETPVLARKIAEANPEADALVMMRQPQWLERIEYQAAVMRLRLIPQHQAREVARRVSFDIPIVDHPLVDTYVNYFTGRGRWFFERWLTRSDRYIPMMQPILERHGVPKDLVYVAMIESGFSFSATSRARACGYWQFIASTGRLYRLRNDVWVDERRDFVRSTEAAAEYLADLYREFGDWHLAWAGYNGGGGRVRRAIAKYGTSDFWTLATQRGALPKETQHYVPKIIAAAIVAKDRVKYGFPAAGTLSPLAYDEVEVNDATQLSAVVRQFGFDELELRELNPSYVHGITPPGRQAKLRVPAGSGAVVAAWLADVPQDERLTYARHKVASGDSLWRVAQQYGANASAIREINRLGGTGRLRVGSTLVIPADIKRRSRVDTAAVDKPQEPSSRPSVVAQVARKAPTSAIHKPSAAITKHRVSRGETLWSISQRYGVSVGQMKSWNSLSDNQVRAGDVLDVYTSTTDVPKT